MVTVNSKLPEPEDERTALTKEALKSAFLDDLFYVQGKFPALATKNDYYMALAFAIRDRMLQRLDQHRSRLHQTGFAHRCVHVREFLMGPHLGNNLINLGIFERVKQCMTELGFNFEELLQQEEEPGLGNGGLGRLGGMLHRFVGDTGSARGGLRHPLRIWNFFPGNHRRLAGGKNRQVAAFRQPLGAGAPGVGRWR